MLDAGIHKMMLADFDHDEDTGVTDAANAKAVCSPHAIKIMMQADEDCANRQA